MISCGIFARIKDFLNGMQDTTFFLTVMLWVCIAPFVLFLTVLFFGWEAGIVAVALTLLIALALCWGICIFPKITQKANSNVDRSRLR